MKKLTITPTRDMMRRYVATHDYDGTIAQRVRLVASEYGMTLDQAREILPQMDAERQAVVRLRDTRAKRQRMPQTMTPAERLRAHRRAEQQACLAAVIDYRPSTGGLTVRTDNTITAPAATVTVSDMGRYSSRCYYHKTSYDAVVTLAERWQIRSIDGVATIVSRTETIGRVNVSSGWVIARRGYKAITISPTIALEIGDIAAHGETRSEAIEMLRRKMQSLARRAEPVTLDTVITPAKYQEITGACTQGTDAWLAEVGLTRRSRMSVRDALALLADHPGWGADRLRAAVTAE